MVTYGAKGALSDLWVLQRVWSLFPAGVTLTSHTHTLFSTGRVNNCDIDEYQTQGRLLGDQ